MDARKWFLVCVFEICLPRGELTMSYFPDFTSVTNLTATQIKNLHTSPILVAPGVAGCVVDIKSIVLEYIAGTQAFNPNASDIIALITGTIPNVFANYAGGIVGASSLFGSTTSKTINGFTWWAGFNVATQPQQLSNVIGQGIQLMHFRSGSIGTGANWTLGNGTAKLTIQYSYIVA